MKKTFKLYAVIFLLMIGLLLLIEANKTSLTNWNKNYDIEEKSPFGLFIFHKEAKQLFNNKLEEVNLSPYTYYSDSISPPPHNILIHELSLDFESWKKLLKNVEQGSDLMLFSDYIHATIADSLKIHLSGAYYSYKEKDVLKLTDKKLEADSLILDKMPNNRNFTKIADSVQVLGYNTDYQGDANFIKLKHGQGHIYLHSEPLVLTNYYMLDPKGLAYIEGVLSYLPDRESIWFTKEKRIFESNSLLRFILDNPPLRYAWWLFLGSLLLFAIFNSRRKQRIVPIITPLENKSLEFVKSIGNLYLQEGDLKEMAEKKIQYFLYYLRTDLLLDTKSLDEKFVQSLHLKTGKSLKSIKQTLELIDKVQNSELKIVEEDLIRLNRLINQIIK